MPECYSNDILLYQDLLTIMLWPLKVSVSAVFDNKTRMNITDKMHSTSLIYFMIVSYKAFIAFS